VVSTRHYRAPEVILGLPWSYPCDLWSLGCILAELLSGDALFQTHENLEHLAMMEAVLGRLPPSLARRADERAAAYFRLEERGGAQLRWPEGSSSRDSVRTVRKCVPLRELVCARAGGGPAGQAFCSLLLGLLQYEPEQRLTAAAALRHPFFAGVPPGLPPPPPLPSPPPQPPRAMPPAASSRRGCGMPAEHRPHTRACGV